MIPAGDLRTEKQKMLAGEYYRPPDDPALMDELYQAHAVLLRYNQLPLDAHGAREALLQGFLGHTGENITLRPTFYCDYGSNIFLSDDVFINFNCVFLDCAPITIGRGTLIAPNVQLYTAAHPLEAADRRAGWEFAKPITIGEDAWIGGNAVVLPGVTIGDRAVVAAGSIVTRDVPADTLVVGNPARLVRRLA